MVFFAWIFVGFVSEQKRNGAVFNGKMGKGEGSAKWIFSAFASHKVFFQINNQAAPGCALIISSIALPWHVQRV